MNKLKILSSMALIGFVLLGCNGEGEVSNGFVKLENTNPTIKQENYDAMINKLKEKITNKDFEFYHAETLFNGENWKNYTSEDAFGKFTAWKQQGRLINDQNLVVVVVDKNNNKVGSAYEIKCSKYGKFECDPEHIIVVPNGK
ncbi:hypothetical protein [Campylobacter ureolyticus]|uniref:hypothetical protein n=1 Tax=Campylobacter ureolyticus TaxID=827 RepID=UPI001FC87E84|nr:hypothetical protein [Campylobacter ureolyticus]MCZ6158773.1 hypothetical protein [Campylobacter ureolyticus]